MPVKILICLDGCSPAYLDQSSTPNLDSLARCGFMHIGQAVIPSVTNVNNTSIVTASFPESHGITSNYYLDPESGNEFYMESPEYLLSETMFQKVARRGGKSALLTAKNKLKSLIRAGATIAESAEKPPEWLVEKLGPPPSMYSVEINHWLFRAAAEVVREHAPDLLYVTTTDYAMHKYAPEDEKSRWNVAEIDRLLGELLDTAGEFEVVVTADHGMNAKSHALDLNRILDGAGIGGNAIPIIKDRYVAHHQNMGGAAYVYLDDLVSMPDAMQLLREQHGVECVAPSIEAARTYHMHPGRAGHIFVLADKDTVFGSLHGPCEEVQIRSHGSLHERDVPIFGCGAGPMAALPKSNREVASWVF